MGQKGRGPALCEFVISSITSDGDFAPATAPLLRPIRGTRAVNPKQSCANAEPLQVETDGRRHTLARAGGHRDHDSHRRGAPWDVLQRTRACRSSSVACTMRRVQPSPAQISRKLGAPVAKEGLHVTALLLDRKRLEYRPLVDDRRHVKALPHQRQQDSCMSASTTHCRSYGDCIRCNARPEPSPVTRGARVIIACPDWSWRSTKHLVASSAL